MYTYQRQPFSSSGDVESPGLAQVTPASPGAPFLGESGSASDITIEWEDGNSFSDISYWLDYSLQRIDGSMDMDQIIVSSVNSTASILVWFHII